jgi:hypothetical protein
VILSVSGMVGGLACFSLRGEPRGSRSGKNGADGFDLRPVCQCDFVYPAGRLGQTGPTIVVSPGLARLMGRQKLAGSNRPLRSLRMT